MSIDVVVPLTVKFPGIVTSLPLKVDPSMRTLPVVEAIVRLPVPLWVTFCEFPESVTVPARSAVPLTSRLPATLIACDA